MLQPTKKAIGRPTILISAVLKRAAASFMAFLISGWILISTLLKGDFVRKGL